MTQNDLSEIGRERAFIIKDLVENSSDFKNWLWKNGLGVRRRSNGNIYFWCNKTNKSLTNFEGHDLYIASKNSKA